jgi:CRP-like cAMP-binding protein
MPFAPARDRAVKPPPQQGGRATLLTDATSLVRGPPGLCDMLAPAQRDRVLAQGRRQSYARGATLFTQGAAHDAIYLIEVGRVRVYYIAPAGREITLAYWYPGNFVGGPEVFDGGTHMWSASAMIATTVLAIPGRALRSLAAEMPQLALSLIDNLVFKGKCYSTLAQMLGTRSVTQRLAQLLLHLGDSYGVPDDKGTLVAASFSHADLAHMVGATRQWVTINLARLQAQGIIEMRKSRLVLLQPDLLHQIRLADKSIASIA